jgi:hypothetical protein
MTTNTSIPIFGSFKRALNNAGIPTKSARAFWGGISNSGDIVVTSWTDEEREYGRRTIHRPRSNHGRLKDAWDAGNIKVGAEVKVILLRRRGSPEQVPAAIKDAALLGNVWRVISVAQRSADIEEVGATK